MLAIHNFNAPFTFYFGQEKAREKERVQLFFNLHKLTAFTLNLYIFKLSLCQLISSHVHQVLKVLPNLGIHNPREILGNGATIIKPSFIENYLSISR